MGVWHMGQDYAVVIMAGGKGTRIREVAEDIPKPMIPIGGRPVLEHQIMCLRGQGVTDVCLAIGHLGDVIRDYFGDGHNYGVNIEYVQEREPLGTAGALALLEEKLEGDFLLINGDVMFHVDVVRFHNFHRQKGGIATLFAHPNDHPFDSGILVCDQDGRITDWLHKENRGGDYKNRVNAGLHFFKKDILTYIGGRGRVDLDRDVLKPIIGRERVYAYTSPEYVKDMGTPQRYREITEDLESGLMVKRNLANRQKAIFLDRDGTINIEKGFITKAEDVELIEGAAEAIRLINQSEYLAVLVTNQPVIARGDCTWEELESIHNRLETLLGERGAYLDAMYCCPHHPDKGFVGERAEYKIACHCRKPEPGLLYQASDEYGIDLSASYMVGNKDKDVQAGERAGCRASILARDGLRPDIVEGIMDGGVDG